LIRGLHVPIIPALDAGSYTLYIFVSHAFAAEYTLTADVFGLRWRFGSTQVVSMGVVGSCSSIGGFGVGWGARKKTGTPTFNSKATLTTCPSDRMKLDKTSNERHNTVSACVCVKAKLHHFTDGVNRGGQYLRF